jgi:hypothetical protein
MNFGPTIKAIAETVRKPKTWENTAKLAGIVAAGAALVGEIAEHFTAKDEDTKPKSRAQLVCGATVLGATIATGIQDISSQISELAPGSREDRNSKAFKAATERANQIAADAASRIEAVDTQ